jgi:AraC-like DNA-binding protein
LLLEQAGLSPSAALARAGLPPDALREPPLWLTIDAYFALWDAIAAESADPMLGARLGGSYPEEVLEPAFLALLGSRDLGEALDRLARYKRTLCPETLVLEPGDGRVAVHYDWPTATRAPPPILVEAELSFLLHLARKATRQPLSDARVSLTRRGADAAGWAARLGAEVRLGTRRSTLSLPAAIFAVPFATFNPSLLAVLDPALTAEQSVGASVATDAVASVRRVLMRRLGEGELALRHVADELRMSARTLQRELRDAGTSFAELLRDTRRDRATFYLRQSQLTLSEIAFLLGFDTPTSFFRAFARWTGQTPRSFREGAIG